MLNFIVLGLIPGTNLQITVAWFMSGLVIFAAFFMALRQLGRFKRRLLRALPVVMLSQLHQ
ncbi:hypothetical protein A3D14_00770 [Candidatus Saccharibacteria bacterium RIFCSPHIGHO2_02_FULL_47_12]|nr:MAG: hypothetical protein A3D14_00770 [Candidatus Saccharibacteria bacterium RIFCSPHIGHO2_02_FULL_47_12]